METSSALLALCAGKPPVTGESPSQRPVARSFDVFFDLRLKKRLSKHSRRRWFEKPSSQLWYWKCNINTIFKPHVFRFLNYNHAFSFLHFIENVLTRTKSIIKCSRMTTSMAWIVFDVYIYQYILIVTIYCEKSFVVLRLNNRRCARGF